MSTHHRCHCLPRPVRQCLSGEVLAIFGFMYPSLAPVQISPVFTLQLHLDCRNMESTHYSEVLGCPTEGCRKKDEWSEGWMGGALVWHQSQLRIGCCPGNGTSDLIYPFAVRALRSRPRLFILLCAFLVALLGLRAKTLLLVPFFPPFTLLLREWPPPRRAGERVKSEHLQLLPCWWARRGNNSTVFWSNGEKENRAVDCETALSSIYIVDSNFIPLQKSR